LLIGHDSILYDPLELMPDLREAVPCTGELASEKREDGHGRPPPVFITP
jgi:hypothetical protein